MTNYMSLTDSRYARIMTWATEQTTVITMAQLLNPDTPDDLTTTRQASVLYYVLSGLLEGQAFVLIDQVEDADGLEAWRKLHARYAKTKTQSAIMGLVTIVNTKFHNDKDFETKFSKWDNDITKFERAIGK